MAMLWISISASAYSFEVDGIYYYITNTSTNEVNVTYKTTSYNSYTGVVNIPSTVSYNGTTYTITGIGYSAFRKCSNLISVTIPNSVKKIDDWAFGECRNLKSITIGSGVTAIGDYAFSHQYNYNNTVSYGPYSIPKAIWLGNTPPSGADEIKAQRNYVSNDQFELSNQTVYPFLSSRFEVDGVIYVPISPSERTCDVIDCNYDPTNTEITINSYVVNKNVKLKVLNVNNYAFYCNSKITKLEISNDGYIGASGFEDCGNLKHVSLGTNITRIEDNAFSSNHSLETIVIPDNIKSLGTSAFSYCSSLQDVSIGRGITKLPNSLFYNCGALHSIVIPNTIDIIGDNTFNGCSNLGNVTFEEDDTPDTPTYAKDWTSSNHAHDSSSSQIYSIDVVSGDILSFEIWSDSEATNDKLTVYLNNTSIAKISGLNKTQSITKSFSSPRL